MFFYIRINSNNSIVYAVSSSEEKKDKDLIPLSDKEFENVGKYSKFDINTRTFSVMIDDYVSDLDKVKQDKILISKQQLAVWLENNPIFSTIHNSSGEYYTVTQEKQTQLTQMITLASLAAQTSQSFTPTWNSTSNICEEWTINELTVLTFQITQYVLPRVKKQQSYEVQIRECQTIEEVESIEIDYATI